MIAPRWRKVLRDLWANRLRTVLIVLTIAAGVFAIGTIGATEIALQRQLPEEYQSINPAHILFTTSEFDLELVDGIQSMEGVADVEARRNLPVRVLIDPTTNTWKDLGLFVIPDFDDIRIDKIFYQSGQWPPEDRTLLIERSSLDYLKLQTGQKIAIKTPWGKKRELTISGTAHDLYHMPPVLEGTVYGYITEDTLIWLGEEVEYNEMHVRLNGNVYDASYMRQMTEEITDHIEGAGEIVYITERPKPDGYPMDYIANTILLLLILLGTLILLLGAFLVISTMSALVAQQARQIAVIKAIGGRTRQVTGIYLSLVLILGILSALLAIPPSFIGARALVNFVASMLNFNAHLDHLPIEVIVLQLCVAILAPIAAALVPILGSARQSPANTLSEYGRNQVWSGVKSIDHLLHVLPGITRLEKLAFRNPFRNRSRLIFSLLMLSLAGGSFITVLNLQVSLQKTVDTMLSFWHYDFWVALNQPYLAERLEREALRVPGVTAVEGWGFELTRRVRPDGSESNPIYLYGAPPESDMTQPTILEGRWLRPDDQNAIVIGMGLLDVEPDLGVGKEMTLKINGEEQNFHIVGVIHMIGNQTIGYLCYTSFDTFNELSNKVNRADLVVVRTAAASTEERQALGTWVENTYEKAGIDVVSVLQMDDERSEIHSSFGIIIALLLIMVMLLALVGGLGLMGTMSLNVIERAREIGVIRAFGGSNRSVFRVVTLEGVAIGVMSWFFSLILAAPLTWLFCDLIGHSFLSIALGYQYSISAALLWLAIVVILAVISSALPASNAVRLTVREVLSYE
jgi:putative ABC transport system permease protein